jgi:large subunit ribosomal protein L19
MKNPIIDSFEKSSFTATKTHPNFRPGDTLKVHYKIEEPAKGKETEKKYRLQIFEGICIGKNNSGLSSTFTVRKIGANSVGVERVFPFNSPFVEKIELVAGGDVRRSKLFYLRNLFGKSARIKTRRLPSDQATVTVDLNNSKNA